MYMYIRHQTELKEGSIIMETPTCSSLFVNDDYHKQTDLHVLQQCSHHIDDTYLIEERISAVVSKILHVPYWISLCVLIHLTVPYCKLLPYISLGSYF